MMLAPFPRTSIYPTIGNRVQKNNKKLGKVSHQMQKIIEDIQGKSDIEVKRKLTKDASHPERRPHSRKSRRAREHEIELREMACQTTMLAAPEESQKADYKRRIATSCENQKWRSAEKNCERRSQKINFQSRSPDENCRTDTKRSKVEENVYQAPWKRPLPPVPGAVSQEKNTQANLYQKVFETLKARMQTGTANVNQREGCHDNRWTSLAFSPSRSFSKQLEERESRKECLRYVDIDLLSEKKSKPKSDTQNSVSQHCGFSDDDEDDHIYESIDENSDCEPDFRSPNSPELSSGRNGPVPIHHLSNFFSFSSSTPVSFRNFRHEDTYLEPICPHDQLRNMPNQTSDNTDIRQALCGQRTKDLSGNLSGSNEITGVFCSDENPKLLCSHHINDFQYSRDSAGSPTWSFHSLPEEPIPLKATYV